MRPANKCKATKPGTYSTHPTAIDLNQLHEFDEFSQYTWSWRHQRFDSLWCHMKNSTTFSNQTPIVEINPWNSMDISACEISHLCHWDTMELNWIYRSGLSLSARYPIAYHYYSLAIIFPLSTSIYHQTPSSQIIPWTDPNGFIPREIPRKFHGSSHLGKWLIMSLTGVRFLGPLNYSKLDSMILKNWNTSTSTDIKLLTIWSWSWCL